MSSFVSYAPNSVVSYKRLVLHQQDVRLRGFVPRTRTPPPGTSWPGAAPPSGRAPRTAGLTNGMSRAVVGKINIYGYPVVQVGAQGIARVYPVGLGPNYTRWSW